MTNPPPPTPPPEPAPSPPKELAEKLARAQEIMSVIKHLLYRLEVQLNDLCRKVCDLEQDEVDDEKVVEDKPRQPRRKQLKRPK